MKQGIVGIYLAAGSSRRMGENKLALPLGSTSVGSLALQTALASDLDHIYLVTKETDTLDWLDSSLLQLGTMGKWTQVKVKDSIKGQAYSLKEGLRAAIREGEAAGFMVILADQPFLSKKTINELIAGYHNLLSENTFLAACYQGVPRPPVIFSNKALPKLLRLEGDKGARALIQTGILKGNMLDFSDDKEFIDIDTKAAYDMIKGAGPGHGST